MIAPASTPAYERPHLPVTSAAPVSFVSGDTRAHFEMAKELAAELEGRRRTYTLGGSLLLIPGAAGIALAASALVGVSGLWLPLCALAGLAVGPALCTAVMAATNLLGGPAVRRRFAQHARELGLSDDDIERAWSEATTALDERARARLSGRREAMLPLARDEQPGQG